MAEYIEREAIIEAFDLWFKLIRTRPSIDGAKTLIQQVPATDVAPVRHGRWQTHLGWGWVWRCSCCEYKMGRKEFFKIKRNYCPNCGAKMDGGESA